VIRRRYTQRSVFEVLLPDGEKLWTPQLRRMDAILEDEVLVDLVEEALSRRRPRSRRLGRPSTPAEVVLRMLVLKHLYDWTFEECEREVRGSLVHRAFCRIDCERVPDAKTLVRVGKLLRGEDLKKILGRLVELGVEGGMLRGARLRVDTTVVETNIHYPTDSMLLADGLRVLTRTAKKLVFVFRDRTRSASRRVYEIAQLGRRLLQEKARDRMKAAYQELMAIVRAAVRDAESVSKKMAGKRVKAKKALRTRIPVLLGKLRDVIGLIQRVLDQTRARVLKGDTHFPGKLLSLFETHTEAIRKGKVVKPTEFGKLVKIQEAENQFVTDYEVCATRIPDHDLWIPSLIAHQHLFGRSPHLAVADAGFASKKNERAAQDMGVRRVVLPIVSKAKKVHSKQRWFRRGLRWRTGCEGRISTLKRRHGLRRCRYRGSDGMERWLGLGIIANNLEALAHTPSPRA